MESHRKNDISIRVLVEETLGNTVDKRFDQVEYQSLQTFQINNVKDGYYTVRYKDEIIDFPNDWSAFAVVTEDNVIDISDYDVLLNSVLEEFFGMSGDFKLVKSLDSMYFVFSPQVQKKAA